MIQIAKQNGLIAGLADHVIEGGYVILQYVDDTILFIQDDMESARNLKLLLYIFESMSGLKINFEKSEVLLVQSDDARLSFSIVKLVLGPLNTWALPCVPEEQ
jgi:hypothetical protein